MKDLKIICDIDGIVADFMGHYKKWFNVDAPTDMPVVLEFK